MFVAFLFLVGTIFKIDVSLFQKTCVCFDKNTRVFLSKDTTVLLKRHVCFIVLLQELYSYAFQEVVCFV